MDYGFVEAYPRRFVFHVDAEGGYRRKAEFLTVEIDEDPEDPSKRTFDWHFRTPTDAQIHWINTQLNRLKDMEYNMEKGLEALPEGHEKTTILNYYLAYREALQLAFAHRNDKVSKNTHFPKFDFDDDEEDDDEEDGDEL